MSLVGKWFGFESQELFDGGMAAHGRGAYEEAIEALDACIEAGADGATIRLARFYLADSHSMFARHLTRMGDHASASVSVRNALAINSEYPDLHLLAAKIHRRLDRPEVMEHHLKRALELNPRYADALIFRGASEYERGNHAYGLETVAQACDIDTLLDIEAFEAAKQSHVAGDHLRASAELYAISSKRDAANLFKDLGDLCMRRNEFREAVFEYSRAVGLAPIYADLQCRLGRALLELGSAQEAEARFRAAIQLNPSYAEAHARLGLALRAQDRHAEAEREFKRALDLAPDQEVTWAETRRLAS